MGAVVRKRPAEPVRVAIYSAHAEYLADELLKIMPVENPPPILNGRPLERDLSM
jgi:hypothetical protein